MGKVKINPGLAAVILVASFLGGVATLATVAILLFLFCEVDEKVQKVAVKLLTFIIALTLFTLIWNLIYGGIAEVIGSLKDLINTYADYSTSATVTKVFKPFELALSVTDEVVSILITVAKIAFVFAVLAGKDKESQSFVAKKIDEFVNKALGFINNVNGVRTETTAATTEADSPISNG